MVPNGLDYLQKLQPVVMTTLSFQWICLDFSCSVCHLGPLPYPDNGDLHGGHSQSQRHRDPGCRRPLVSRHHRVWRLSGGNNAIILGLRTFNFAGAHLCSRFSSQWPDTVSVSPQFWSATSHRAAHCWSCGGEYITGSHPAAWTEYFYSGRQCVAQWGHVCYVWMDVRGVQSISTVLYCMYRSGPLPQRAVAATLPGSCDAADHASEQRVCVCVFSLPGHNRLTRLGTLRLLPRQAAVPPIPPV